MSDSSKTVSIENKDSECPEMAYFMNEKESDVVFIIEGKPLPAEKRFLSIRNKVFRVMFSSNFKEEKEVEIKETTFEAFKTLIEFIYTDQLVLKDTTDVKLMDEVFQLSDRYEVLKLMRKVTKIMKTIDVMMRNFEAMTRIAFRTEDEELIENVVKFMSRYSDFFFNLKDDEKLIKWSESTHYQLLKVMATEYIVIKNRNHYLGQSLDGQHRCPTYKCNSCEQIVIYYLADSIPIRNRICGKCGQRNLESHKINY